MTAYFDPTVDSAIYLPPSLRSDQDLANVCAQAESDVIAFYRVTTYRRGVSLFTARSQDFIYPGIDAAAYREVPDAYNYICLRNYNPDASLVTDQNFLVAMKREIAEVVRWRLARSRKEALAASVGGAGGQSKSTTFRSDSESQLPPNFGSKLRTWDVRPQTGVI